MTHHEIDPKALAVIIFKVIVCIISLLICFCHLSLTIQYDDMQTLFPDYDGGEFSGYIMMFGVMSTASSAFGAGLYYMDSDTNVHAYLRSATQSYMIWDFALLAKMVGSAVITVYASFGTNTLFDNGFFPAMRKYRTDEKVRILIYKVQKRHSCCGNFNYSEWFKINWKVSMSEYLTGFPAVCCDKVEAELRGVTCISEIDYKDIGRLVPIEFGCLDTLRWWYYLYFIITALLFSVGGLVQLLTFIVSIILSCQQLSVTSTDEQKRALMQQTAIYNAAKAMGTNI